MTRYQITYSKRGVPFAYWMDDAAAAHKFADCLRKAGYSVDVWMHTQSGAQKTDL